LKKLLFCSIGILLPVLILFSAPPLTSNILHNPVTTVSNHLSSITETVSLLTNNLLSATPITGKVTNEKGEPVTGAGIKVKGSSKGTVTNEKGEFQLDNLSADATLVISFIGYEPQEIKPAGKTYLQVQLKLSVSELDQVQIIAYGTTTKRLNTGDVSKITSEEIEKQPVSNVLAALEGRVPGLIITQANGLPGSAFKVQIRGQNSIAQGSDPLFVIDGVPFASNNTSLSQFSSAAGTGLSPFNSIIPADIESIEVLKDADATAIYGSRGANGVILITTKKGKSGKMQININAYSGTSRITAGPQMMNTKQYLQMRREALTNDKVTPTISNAPDLLLWDTSRYTDFKKLLIGGTANSTDAQGSVSGGSTNTQFLIGGGYHHESTIFPGDLADNRGSFHLNLGHSSTDQKFTMSFSAMYSSDKNNLISNDLTASLKLVPDLPALFDSTGNLVWRQGGVRFTNPLAYLKKTYTSQTNNLLSNLQFNYHILSYITLRTSLGYNTIQNTEVQLNPIAAQDPGLSPTGSSQFGSSMAKTWIVEPQAEYVKTILKGSLDILIGGTWQEQSNTSCSIYAAGYTSDNLLQSLGGASSLQAFNNYADYHYEALFGRINYDWQNKYLLNISARRDGSSRFGPGKQFGNFGAVGAAWIFSNESFFRNALSFISFGKLRGSYGITGNDQIGDYNYLDTWSSTNLPYQGVSGLYPTQLFNPDYSWEINRKLEGAIELGFLKDRILLTTSYFRNRSSNQLVSYSLPAQTGFSGLPVANFPATVQNTGLEFTLTTKNIATKLFSWTSSFTLSVPRNKLVAFPGIATSSYASSLVVGQSLHVLYAPHFTGVNPTTGIFTFQTKNSNGIPSYPDDYFIEGNSDPKYYGGFRNSFSYKGWQLDIFFEGRKQMGTNYLLSVYNNLPPGRFSVGSGNQPIGVLDRWQKSGDLTSIQKVTATPSTAAYKTISTYTQSDAGITNASFVRLKNLSLSYAIPNNTTKKWHISLNRLYIQGQNLFTITKYKGTDPETQNVYALPPLKVITAGIQFIF